MADSFFGWDVSKYQTLFTGWFKSLFSWVSDIFGLLNRWSAPILSVSAGLLAFLQGPVTLLAWAVTQLVSGLSSLVLPSSFVSAWNAGVPTVTTYLSFFNSFLPVSETFAFGSALFGLWAVCTGYRLVKSYVPTLS